MDDKILHQDDVEDVVKDELAASSAVGVIADLPTPSVGYVQGEATGVKNAVNGILQALRDEGIIPTP